MASAGKLIGVVPFGVHVAAGVNTWVGAGVAAALRLAKYDIAPAPLAITHNPMMPIINMIIKLIFTKILFGKGL